MFTNDELKALYDLIAMLSGHSPENVFARDGTGSLDDPTTRAMVKLFRAVGRGQLVPKNLGEVKS